jgi:hypothetical protein
VRYVASVEGAEVCRYTWAAGPRLENVVLEIEFAAEAPLFNRALAVALGPFIEEEARSLSEELAPRGGGE